MHWMHYSCKWQYLVIPEHILHHPAFGTSSTLSRLRWGVKKQVDWVHLFLWCNGCNSMDSSLYCACSSLTSPLYSCEMMLLNVEASNDFMVATNAWRVPKEAVPEEYFNLDNMEGFEKQIMSIMETVKKQWQPQQPSLSWRPARSNQSQPTPVDWGQSQAAPDQQSDTRSLPKNLPQLQPQQQ